MSSDQNHDETNRQRRIMARREAERLRRDPRWQHNNSQSITEKMQELVAHEHAQQAQLDSENCEECAKIREVTGDPSQLCPKHLSQAMGF